MKKLATAAFLGLLVLPMRAGATEAVAHLSDPTFGFSVDLPSIGDPTGALVVQRLIVMGPTADAFAPNCNIQIQYTDVGLDAYMALTHKQFTTAAFRTVTDNRRTTSKLPSALIEYTGSLGGRDLHFLTLAVAGPDRVWLVTCTALAESYAGHRTAFTQLIESFSVQQQAPSSRQ
jgi:hypothetical protein